jgi:hypothetical protein
MAEFFQTVLDGGQPWGMVVVVVLIVFTTWLLGSVVEEIRKYACHRKDNELKRELVERGLSGEEIERVVQARPDTPKQ